MRLVDARQVIEALLCASDNRVSLVGAVFYVECSYTEAMKAVDSTYGDMSEKTRYHDRLAEAAYRLIESSPVLCREWFGVASAKL